MGGDCRCDIGKSAKPGLARTDPGAQHRHAFACVIGAMPCRVIAMVGGENRQITMRVNRIDTINGEETPKVSVAHFSTTGREPTL